MCPPQSALSVFLKVLSFLLLKLFKRFDQLAVDQSALHNYVTTGSGNHMFTTGWQPHMVANSIHLDHGRLKINLFYILYRELDFTVFRYL